ncbi:NTF2 and RRM domain-containing protein [Coniochaeta sp. 2T2.1]|nr:NTF2 and RRM domain-containing protein [Coniochaeta sp. 2T2.1]
MATNGNVNFQEGSQVADNTSQQSSSHSPGKDEVGWYFVEQFYNNLSRNPEKLHLFYGKRSQFVYGKEAEITTVAVGRQSIQERIKNQSFHECKVRVTNVDSQESGDNIVIQVIGELSNNNLEPKKFVQTFVLAQQPSGYFVLNDIMRYIDEGLEEEEVTAPEAQEAPAAKPETARPIEGRIEPESSPVKEEEPAKEPEAAPLDTAKVDQKLEEATSAPAETAPAEKATEAPTDAEPAVVETKEDAQPEAPSAEQAIKEVEKEEAKAEAPKEPSPTPAAPRAAPVEKQAPAEPPKPKEPPKPMTWASRIAAAAAPVAKAIAPVIPKVATPPAPSHARQPAPAAAQKAPAPATQATEAAAPASKDSNDEWQSVSDSKRQNRPVSISGPQETGREGAMAYIKYVTDKINADDLRAELTQYGELAYFDVNRTKNCAFVEFKNVAGYNAAVNANPHTVNGETIVVEQRRPKANAYGGVNYSGTRGGAANRGRGGFEGQRQNSQGPRTGGPGFQGQARGGRGGASARGGAGARAGSQATA